MSTIFGDRHSRIVQGAHLGYQGHRRQSYPSQDLKMIDLNGIDKGRLPWP